MPTVYVGARIDRELAKRLDDLVSGGKGKNRSAIIREALNDYASAYTGEPTLRGLETRIKAIELRLSKVEDALIKAGGKTFSAKEAETS